MKKESKFERFKEWSGLNAETMYERLQVAVAWLVCIFVGALVLGLAILLWQLTLFFLALILVFAILTSPLWIWILKGKK